MNVLFVHDHKLQELNGEYYSTGGFADEVTERYTDVFNNMTLMCRIADKSKKDKLKKISNKQVQIVGFKRNLLIPNKKMLNMIQKEVLKHDKIIIRLPSILGIYAAYYAKKNNKKICVEVVANIFESYWFKNILGKILSTFLLIINKNIIKEADYVLYVTNDYLQNKYPTNGKKISCSDVVLLQHDENILKKRIDKISNYKKEDKFIFGTLAQVDQKYKGHKTMFKVIKRLINKGYNVEYALAGSGNNKKLKKLAQKLGILDNIRFDGIINHNNVNEWIDGIDLYVQPSLTEGMPRSVIEVIYRGCPAIVSSAGGMYELVDQEYIFKKGSSNDLLKVLNNLNKNKLKKIAQNNYYFAEQFEPFKLNEIRNKFYEEYRKDRISK